MTNKTELDEIKQLCQEYLAQLEKEKRELEKTIATFERKQSSNTPEGRIKAEVLYKQQDLLENKTLDVETLLLNMPKPGAGMDAHAMSWGAWLEYMDNTKVREEEGRKIELLRLAAEASKQRLSQWHTYEDGTVDQPLLTPETVRGDHE